MISSSRIPRFWLWLCVLGALALAVPVTRWAQQRRQPQRDVRGVRVKLVNALPAQSKRWALVIGVDQYRDSRITPLKGAANDAKLLAEALTNYAGFPAAQVFVLTTNQDADHQPTRANVFEYLYKLRDSVPPDGLLLLSFAGHGIERNRQAFLIPTDAGFRDDLPYMREVAVSVTTVREIIRDANVAQKIILLDHCRSDPAASRAEAPNLLTPPWRNAFNFQVVNHGVDAFFTLYATGIGQRAYESSETRQGYFTQAVVEALSGAAANDKGEVTLGALLRYVQDEVPKRVQRALGKNTLQQPHEETVGYRVNDLVIAAVTPKPAAVATVKEPERPAVDPQLLELENRRTENAFWEAIKDSKDVAEYEMFLKKWPNGEFAELARVRLARYKTPNVPQPKSDDTSSVDSSTVDTENKTSPDSLTRPGKILERARAKYPVEAMRAGIQGRVVLDVIVGADGKIGGIDVVESLPFGLTESVIAAARLTQFSPATRNNQPVTSRHKLTYTFSKTKGKMNIWHPATASLEKPLIISRAKVVYNKDAQSNIKEGIVPLDIIIRENGKVGDIYATSGPLGGLTAQAINAIKQFRFQPARYQGKAVSTWDKVVFKFKSGSETTVEFTYAK